MNLKNSCAKVLAIIPARGGSKGLPRKNILPLGGKPLIAWSIEAALSMHHVDRIVVSTEDEEIAEVARQWGAEVPFLRPAEMSTDDASPVLAVNHMMMKLTEAGYQPDFVCTLSPTSPFRSTPMLNFLVDKALEGYARVFTVKKLPAHSGLFSPCRGRLKPVVDKDLGFDTSRSYYRSYGVFNLWRAGIREEGLGYVHIIKDKAELVDIDTPQDLRLAELILHNRLYAFGR